MAKYPRTVADFKEMEKACDRAVIEAFSRSKAKAPELPRKF